MRSQAHKTTALVRVSLYVYLAFAIAQFGCGGGQTPAIRSGFPVGATCPAAGNSGQEFFPAEFLGAPLELGLKTSERMATYLRAADQRPLWCSAAPEEAYRILWIASNRPARTADLTKTSEGWLGTGVEFSDPRKIPLAAAPPSTIERRFVSKPSLTDIDAFLKAIETAKLWTIPSWRYSTEAFDGAILSMEMRAEGRYRIIIRGKISDPSFEETVRMLLQAAGVPVLEETKGSGVQTGS